MKRLTNTYFLQIINFFYRIESTFLLNSDLRTRNIEKITERRNSNRYVRIHKEHFLGFKCIIIPILLVTASNTYICSSTVFCFRSVSQILGNVTNDRRNTETRFSFLKSNI